MNWIGSPFPMLLYWYFFSACDECSMYTSLLDGFSSIFVYFVSIFLEDVWCANFFCWKIIGCDGKSPPLRVLFLIGNGVNITWESFHTFKFPTLTFCMYRSDMQYCWKVPLHSGIDQRISHLNVFVCYKIKLWLKYLFGSIHFKAEMMVFH